jgi:hypothetical protein
MRQALIGAFSMLALPGCAALECDTNWFETGRRDGLIGVQPQTEYYTGLCKERLDLARYLDGWHAGAAMRPRQSSP